MATSGPVNIRSPTDPGILVTLFLSPEAAQSFQERRSEIRECLAEELRISPIHVIFWPVCVDGAYVEVSVPAVALARFHRLRTDLSDPLKKHGVLAFTEGQSNCRHVEGKGDMVCLRFAEKSLAAFEKRRVNIISRLVSAVDCEAHQLSDMLIVEEKFGVVVTLRMERTHSNRLCQRLGKADSNHLLQIGLLHATVCQYMAVGAGSLIEKKEEDSKSSRDPDKPLPQPDKPDQAKETWGSWVQLKRGRGCYRGPSIYLVRGKDRGKAAWHYVHVKDSLLSEFLEKTRGGSLDVADYGEVLASGWGEDPPQDLADSIDRDYA